ncbi:MAG: CvpA family protein [Armatimonadetes bacterium]|nr:CvpA family protein [Armatimonadota bacterium]
MLVGLLTYAGYKRGLVPEIFDIVAIIGSLTAALRLYGPFGAALKSSILTAFSDPWAYGMAFFMIWIPVALILFTLGLHVDRVTKDEERIPQVVREWGGLAVALGKSVMLGCLFLGFLGMTPQLTVRDRTSFRTAPVVQAFRNFTPIFYPLVDMMAPQSTARRFRTVIGGNFPEKIR